MSVINRMRRQTAIWWKRTTPDRFGKYSYEAPVEIECRWDDTIEEFQDYKGDIVRSKSLVYVDREMSPGDRLMLGDLESDTSSDPTSLKNAHEIRRFDKNPNFRNTETLLTAFL